MGEHARTTIAEEDTHRRQGGPTGHVGGGHPFSLCLGGDLGHNSGNLLSSVDHLSVRGELVAPGDMVVMSGCAGAMVLWHGEVAGQWHGAKSVELLLCKEEDENKGNNSMSSPLLHPFPYIRGWKCETATGNQRHTVVNLFVSPRSR